MKNMKTLLVACAFLAAGAAQAASHAGAPMTKDAAGKEAMAKDGMKKDAMGKDAKKDAMAKDAKKDGMAKDGAAK